MAMISAWGVDLVTQVSEGGSYFFSPQVLSLGLNNAGAIQAVSVRHTVGQNVCHTDKPLVIVFF